MILLQSPLWQRSSICPRELFLSRQSDFPGGGRERLSLFFFFKMRWYQSDSLDASNFAETSSISCCPLRTIKRTTTINFFLHPAGTGKSESLSEGSERTVSYNSARFFSPCVTIEEEEIWTLEFSPNHSSPIQEGPFFRLRFCNFCCLRVRGKKKKISSSSCTLSDSR